MTLPIDRTALIDAQSNQIPNMVIQSAKNIAAIQVPYDTIDELNTKVNLNYSAGSTGTTQLADGSVTRPKIANSAVGASQLDPSLLGIYGDIAIRAALNKMRYDVTEPPFNAIGDGSNETTKIQAAINAAIAANTKLVFFPTGVYSATALTGLTQVSLIGNNATLTVGAVPTYVEQLSGVSALKSKSATLYSRALSEQVVPLDGLKNSINAINRKSELKIAFVTDSIGENGLLSNTADCFSNRYIDALTKAMPGITITSQNFGLGGRSIAQYNDPNYKGLASEPANINLGFYRSWSTVGKSWKDTVRDYGADLVIFAFGMNEGSTTGFADVNFAIYLNTALTEMRTWSVAADMVVVSTMLPTVNVRQDVYLSVGRTARYFAKNNGLALVDANRLSHILRDGIDDVSRASTYEKNWLNYPTGYNGATSGYSLAGSVLTPTTGGLIQRTRLSFNIALEVSVNPSATGSTGEAQITYRESTDLGNYTLRVGGGPGTGYVKLYSYEVSGGLTLVAQATSLSIPVGSATVIKIVADDDLQTVYVAGVQQISYRSYNNLHDGYISMGSSSTSYPTFSNLTINYRDELTGGAVYTETELLGVGPLTNDQGNGYNHPSPLGHEVMYFAGFNRIISELSDRAFYNQPSLIRNGNFDIFPFGNSITNPATNTYFAAGWKVNVNNGGGTLPTIVHSRQILTSGELPGAFYFYRKNVDGAGTSLGSSSASLLTQYFENGTRNLCGLGKKVTFEFWFRSDIVGKRIGIYGVQNYGTGGSPSAQETINGTNVTVTATLTKYTITLTTNTLVGKTFGTNNDDYMGITIQDMWGSIYNAAVGSSTAETYISAGNIDYAHIDGNVGDRVIPYRVKDVEEETRKSLRYTWVPQINSVFARLTSYTTNTLVFDVPLPVQFRALATVTIRGTIVTDYTVNTVAGVAQTGLTGATASVTSNGVRVTITKAAHGLTDGVLEIKTTSGFIAEI